MKVAHVLILAAAAALSAQCAARAADVPSPSAFTIKAGANIQTTSAAANSGFAAGLDYIFHPSSTLEPFNVSFYGDLLGKNAGGIGVAVRNGGPAYIGAGIGLYSVSSTTGLGGKVFGGFHVAPFTSMELGYNIMPSTHGVQSNSVTAELALRF